MPNRKPNDDRLFARLFTMALDAILIADDERRYVDANPAACTLLGRSREEILTLRIEDVVLGAPGEVETIWRRFRADGEFRGESVIVRPDGTRRVVESHAAASIVPGRHVSILRDVTARREVEEALDLSERRFARLAESNLFGVVSADQDRIRTANDYFLRLSGYTAEELSQLPWQSVLVPPEGERLLRHAIEQLRTEGICRPYESDIVTKDGRRVPVFAGAAIVTEAPLAWVSFVLDLTERKRIELALQDADRRKDEFLAMLGHELRNPLGPIRNAVELLQIVGPDEPRAQHARDMIARQVRHLVRMVDDLLDISRITHGKIAIRKEPLELADVLRQAIETVRPVIDQRQHDLSVTIPREGLFVQGDRTRLVQVFVNLLNNAAKFTDPDGRIAVAIERRGDDAVVRLTDSGVGIDAEALGRIFELFAQGSAEPDRRRGGLGIGLTLVRALVELHDGRISAASAGPGAGSTFEVSLPLLPPALPLTSRERPARTPTSRRLRVLVVDDNRDLASSLAALLEIAGHEVRAVYDAPSALTEAESFTADVAFIDIGLPGIDGYELARRLRGRPNAPSVLIALSGYGRDEDKQRAAAAGFHHHLTKPADPTAIEDLLERLAAGSAASVPAAHLLH